MRAPLFTLGHSNRSSEDFLALLRDAGVEILVDIRVRPRSARHPQFDEAALRALLEAAGIQYHWAGRQLGGLRQAAPDSPHRALPEGLRGYADHMQTELFRRSAAQLRQIMARGTTAVMCAERLPEDCHRRLLSDYLTLEGITVVHLIGPGESRPHLLSPEARRESAALIYDRHLSGELPLE